MDVSGREVTVGLVLGVIGGVVLVVVGVRLPLWVALPAGAVCVWWAWRWRR